MSDDEVVADASAILALLIGEPFERIDPERITRSWVSAVNLSEVLAKLYEMGLTDSDADGAVARQSCTALARCDVCGVRRHRMARSKPR